MFGRSRRAFDSPDSCIIPLASKDVAQRSMISRIRSWGRSQPTVGPRLQGISMPGVEYQLATSKPPF